MDNQYEIRDGSLRVFMPRELDHHEAGKLRAQTDLLIENYQIRQLVFDFSQTAFMDSSGLGVIIGRCRNMGYFGGEVVAQNLNERVQKIFTISGLHKIIRTI